MTSRSVLVTGLARESYRDIPLYTGGHAAALPIDLSDNTNQWGVPPAAARALSAVSPASAARYPAAYAPALSEAIAAYAGVTPDMVVTGCGSDHVLDCAFRALADPGSRVAHLDPTFVIVPGVARANSLIPVGIPWRAGEPPNASELEVDEAALLAVDARIIYLCSPNNPTGTVIPPAVIARIVARASGIVIIDEAYAEFGGWSAVSLLADSPGLIVTRTFSKAFGLAGLRIGYALGHPALIRECAKARGPYALSTFAEPAALAALGEDVHWVREHVALAIETRERLAAALRDIGGYVVYPSGANFVMVAPDEGRLPGAMTIQATLRSAGIDVRAFNDLPGIGGALRITVAPWPVMSRLLDALPRPGRS
ncbi:MAG TPA: histidinol-phosphate transaminase [Gemmatimonadaceae bacterium]|nr:histidinol-phosphate transaminase [Gemmatimonadaceae bacterium]